MNINDFLKLNNFDSFKTIGKKLIEINDLPQWFWDKAIIPLNYNMLPDYCKLVNQYRMRYIEIKFDDGDIVAFVFKIVQVIKTKQIKLFEIPFSKNDNINNVNLIIKHLYNTLDKNFVLLSSIYTNGELDVYNCNYYYNYEYYHNKVTNKYRRKHRFARYESNFNLEIFSNLNNTNKQIFIDIYNQWYQLKNNPASSNEFMHALKTKNKNYIYYIGTLNNIPCICGIGIITKFGLYIAFEFSLDRVNILYDSIVIYASKILSEKIYNEFNIYNIYKLGARKNNKGLIAFKERTSKDKIKIYKLNIATLDLTN